MFKTGVSGPGEQPTGVTLVDGYNMLHMASGCPLRPGCAALWGRGSAAQGLPCRTWLRSACQQLHRNVLLKPRHGQV